MYFCFWRVAMTALCGENARKNVGAWIIETVQHTVTFHALLPEQHERVLMLTTDATD